MSETTDTKIDELPEVSSLSDSDLLYVVANDVSQKITKGNFKNTVKPDELIDIRTGADGETYTSAGEAVRSQDTYVNNIVKYAINNSIISTGNWVQGSYSSISSYDNPQPNSQSTRIRCQIVFDYPTNIVISSSNLNYGYTFAGFDANNVEIDSYGAWINTTKTMKNVKTLRLAIRKTNDAAIKPSERLVSGINVQGNPIVQTFGNISDILKELSSVKYTRDSLGKSSWVKGSYSAIGDYDNPSPYNSNTRIRNEIVFDSETTISIKLYDSENYKLNYSGFNRFNVSIAQKADWSCKNVIIKNVKTLRLVLARKNDSNIEPDDYVNSGVAISIGENHSMPIKLKVMTYNIGRFSYGVSPYYLNQNFDEKLANYKSFFASQDADIIGIQEFNVYLDKATGEGTYSSDAYIFDYLYPYKLNTNGGNTLKSKIPFEYLGGLNYTVGSQSCKYGIMIINDKSVFVGCTHLYPNSGSGEDTYRQTQRTELISLMDNFDYVICFGDFNAQTTTDFNDFKNAGYKIANGGYLPFEWTYSFDPSDFNSDVPTSNVRYFDNIIVSSNIIVNNSSRVNVYSDLSSDHIPFIASLTLN